MRLPSSQRVDESVGVGFGQHELEARIGFGAGVAGRLGGGARVDVAHAHQLAAVGMLADRAEVVVGDAAAADQGKADLAVDDGGRVVAHGALSGFRL
jgi:hypothetical protein